ncbi:MAG: GGDEF domain-containing protein [Alphaproteobacteria bacterium]|nr:GGDEF domain-containing protein [Alphaproteobacteria bacterium]
MGRGRALFIQAWHFLATLKKRCAAFAHFQETQAELTSLRQEVQALKEESRIDNLTKLPNERAFYELAQRSFAEATRENFEIVSAMSGHPLKAIAIFAIDIDNFKKVNDEFGGHEAGNKVLVNIADAMRETFHRTVDVRARLHGDELAALICEDGDKIFEVAEKMAENLRAAIERRAPNAHEKIGTASIGVAIIIPIASDVEYIADALKRADDAAYTSKGEGRNRVHIMDSNGIIYPSRLNPDYAVISGTRPTHGNPAPQAAPFSPAG